MLEMVSEWAPTLRRVRDGAPRGGETRPPDGVHPEPAPRPHRGLARPAAPADQAAADGLTMRPVSPPRPDRRAAGPGRQPEPVLRLPDLQGDCSSCRWPSGSRRCRTQRSAAQILSEDPMKESTFPLIQRLVRLMFRFGDPPNYEPAEDIASPRSPPARGAARRRSPTTC